MNRIENKVETTRDRVIDVRNTTNEMIVPIRQGATALTGDVQTTVDEALADLQALASDQIAGRDEFLENKAAPFRADLLALIDDLEILMGQLANVSDCAEGVVVVDLTVLREIIGALPDRALFPVWKGLDIAIPLPTLLCVVEEAVAAVTTLQAVLVTNDLSAEQLSDPSLRLAARAAKLKAIQLKMMAKLLKELSFDSISAIDVGVHGYFHVNFKPGDMKKISVGILEGGAEGLERISEFAESKISNALAIEKLAQEELAIRLEIELQLSDPTRQLSMFYLPEAHGGKLESVRAVVETAIVQNIAAGAYTGTKAQVELAAGNAAATGKNFRLAYDSYRRAYQELAKSPVTASIEQASETGSYALSWPSDPGGVYSVAYSTNLVDWDDVFPHVVGGSGAISTVTDTPTEPTGFYRVFRESSYTH